MKPAAICPNCGHHIVPNLTGRQKRVYDAVVKFWKRHGHAPTLIELSVDLQLSKTAVQRQMEDLVRLKRLTKPFRGQRNIFPVEAAHERAA